MRLRVSLGIILLGASACAHLPELIRVEVDGNSVEVKRKPEPAAPDPQLSDAPER